MDNITNEDEIEQPKPEEVINTIQENNEQIVPEFPIETHIEAKPKTIFQGWTTHLIVGLFVMNLG